MSGLSLHPMGDITLAELSGEGQLVSEVQDVLDLMVNAQMLDADALVLHAGQLPAGFFELRSGLAGEILQKISTYRFRLAILGDFRNPESKSLADFIRESNRTGRVLFVRDMEQAVQIWNGPGGE